MVELAENGVTVRATEPNLYYIQHPEHTLNGRIYRVILYKSQINDMQDKSLCVTTYVYDMSNLFHNQSKFNDDISGWDTSNVKSMDGMFYNNRAFNQNLSKWNVSSVVNMCGMFYNAHSFNSDISSWNISRVRDISFMFQGATQFNVDISKWDVSEIRDMQSLFQYASSFDQDIHTWWNHTVTDDMIEGTLTEYNEYRKIHTHTMMKKIKAELMARTWHPSRIENWCLYEDDIN